MQDELMKFDPATGEPNPYPSHAEQWRRWYGLDCAWLYNPWTGETRTAWDVGSDVNGRLIVPAGTLGSDIGCGAPMQNTANKVAQNKCKWCGHDTDAHDKQYGCAEDGCDCETPNA